MFCTNVFSMLRQLPLFLWRSSQRERSITLLHHREALGDTLLLSALARNLKRVRPDVHLALATRRPELFYNNPHIDENRGWHLWRSGCTASAKYSGKDLGGKLHVVEVQWRALWRELAEAKFPGVESPEPPALDSLHPELFLTPAELNVARKRVSLANLGQSVRKPVVLIGSGGKLKPTHNREWGMVNYRAIAEALRPHAALLQISGEEQLRAGGVALPDLRNIPVRQAAALFSVCDAMLVQEGGLMHVARAVNAPCVSLFGGYVLPRHTGYDEQTNFWSKPECSPCIPLLKDCFHLKCMVGITPRHVLRALAEKIQERSGVALPEEVIEAAPGVWTPPPFVDRALLERELLIRGSGAQFAAIPWPERLS
jgi:ADP-heptose:LPS heptosyltransferase